MKHTAQWVVVLVVGIVILAATISKSIDTGPGSGFKGHTPGFRAMMWMLYAFGLFHVAVGIAGLAMGW